MTIEVELKFRLCDRADLEHRLQDLGAVSGPPQSQADCYLQHPCRDFAVTDEALRIRTVEGRSVLTYKGPVLPGPAKARREIELALGDAVEPQQMEDLLVCLGFQPVLTVRKRRQPYDLDWRGNRYHLAVDDVPPLGLFLEIEVLAEEHDLPLAREALRELAEHLALTSVVEGTYLELMLDTVALPVETEKNKPLHPS